MRYFKLFEDAGELEQTLNLWIEGKMTEAQPKLLALEDVARQYAPTGHVILYRGFLIDNVADVKKNGMTITTNQSSPFSSWSSSQKSVKDFMFGWERPWAMIAMPTEELDTVIDLCKYARSVKPKQNMCDQKEIIVKMPPTLKVPPQRLRVYLR